MMAVVPLANQAKLLRVLAESRSADEVSDWKQLTWSAGKLAAFSGKILADTLAQKATGGILDVLRRP